MMNRISVMSTALIGCALFALCPLMLIGCGDEGVGGTGTGSIQASPSRVAFSSIAIGESGEELLRLQNTSESEDLRILELELVAGSDGHVDELELIDVPGIPIELGPNEEVEIRVRYTPSVNAPANRGDIRVRNTDPQYHESALMVPVNTLGNEAEFFAEPPIVRFQRRQIGQSAEESVRVTNIGSAPMTIFEEPILSGADDFRLDLPPRSYPLQLKSYDSAAAQDSPEDYFLEIGVQYIPQGDGSDSGEIQLESNSGGSNTLHQIDVMANAEAACISVDGRTRNFGQVPIGEVGRDRVTVTNCGTQPLEISGVFLTDESGYFDLDLAGWDQTGDGSVDGSVRLDPDESDGFDIRFIPVEEGTKRAEVLITSNDPVQPELELDLVARGAEGSCPTPVARGSIRGTPMQPSSNITVTPLDYVILDGAESHDEDGEVVSWEWEVLERPPGTQVDLGPTQDDPNDLDDSRREFRPLTAGTYRIGLTVVDEAGFQSCGRSEVLINAIPDQNIHIELTWTNPEDPDETDDFGSDLDLHLTKMGPGEWFKEPYSIFFKYPNQNEDPIWNPENPTLDIDIRNGAGPENITMRNPDPCQWYAIGVHYYQRAHGTAYATVRVYINGSLRFVGGPHFPLEDTGNFWDVGRIHWNEANSDATIIEVDGFYPIAPNAQAPAITSLMSDPSISPDDSPLCTDKNLY